jgi:hypothetical protein
VVPGSDTPIAQKQADFVRQTLFENLDVTWSQTLSDILTMLEYGWSILNKVYIRETGTGGGAKISLAKLAPRHPIDVEHVQYDAFGSPESVWFYPAGAYVVRTDGNPSPLGRLRQRGHRGQDGPIWSSSPWKARATTSRARASAGRCTGTGSSRKP